MVLVLLVCSGHVIINGMEWVDIGLWDVHPTVSRSLNWDH